MTPAELKLALTAAGILLLLGGVFVWLIYDWLMAREKRKRREDYNEWFNMKYVESLMTRDRTLERCQVNVDTIRDRLWEMQSDEYWHSSWEKMWAKHHGSTNWNGRTERTKIDGYHYYKERDK